MITEAKLSGPYQIEDPERGWIVGRVVEQSANAIPMLAPCNLVLLRRDIDGALLWVPSAKLQSYPQGQIEEPAVKGGGS